MIRLSFSIGLTIALAGTAGAESLVAARAIVGNTIVSEADIRFARNDIEGAVSDPAEYQDAWGFTKVASDIAAGIENGEDIQGALEEMLDLWPENAPIPPAEPASPEQVLEAAERVRETLPQ